MVKDEIIKRARSLSISEIGFCRHREKTAVCFPGFEGELTGATVGDTRVAADGRVITAVGMGAALEFGLALVEHLCGREKAAALKRSVLAP